LRWSRAGRLRISLALDVDEALRPIADLPVDVVRIEAELTAGGARDRLGLGHFVRVDVDGGRLLADRELKAAAVEDRPAMCGEVDRLLLLSRCKLLQRLRAHALQPDGAREDEREDEGEGEEEDPDPPVRSARHCRDPRIELDVLRRVGVGGDEPELGARLLLDLLRRGAARQLRLKVAFWAESSTFVRPSLS
jgi:hypothetical protein